MKIQVNDNTKGKSSTTVIIPSGGLGRPPIGRGIGAAVARATGELPCAKPPCFLGLKALASKGK